MFQPAQLLNSPLTQSLIATSVSLGGVHLLSSRLRLLLSFEKQQYYVTTR